MYPNKIPWLEMTIAILFFVWVQQDWLFLESSNSCVSIACMHPWFLVFPLSHPGAQIPSYQPELDTLMIWGNKLSLPEMELEKCLVSLLKYKIVHCLNITKMSHLNFRAKIVQNFTFWFYCSFWKLNESLEMLYNETFWAIFKHCVLYSGHL